MVSTQKKKQQNRLLQSHIDDSDQDDRIDDALSSGQQNVKLNIVSLDWEFSVINKDGISTTTESTLKVPTLEKCITEKIDREVGNNVDTVNDGIQNVIFTGIDKIITPMLELVVRSKSASSGHDATSATPNLERGNRKGIISFFFENMSEGNNTFHKLLAKIETQ